MAIYLVRPLPDTSSGYRVTGGLPLYNSPCSRRGLPPPHVTMRCCKLLPYSFHPYHRSGGFVSVALSLGSRPVAVSDRPVLRCPDFPLVT